MLGGNDKQAKGSFTHLGLGTSFEGKIDVPHDLHVYGDFIGDIVCKGSLTLGTKGFVKGIISAKSAIVGGRIEGSISCTGGIELESTAVMIGDLSARDLTNPQGGAVSREKFYGREERRITFFAIN